MPRQGETVEERLDRIETLIERLIVSARKHPLGRQLLTMLGLS